MHLSDGSIRRLIASERLVISPFDHSSLQPAGYDCHLGRELKMLRSDGPIDPFHSSDLEWESTVLTDDGTYLLQRGEFILGHTVEWFGIPDDIAASMNGKSSLGRLGLAVHVTAGFCDPGFCGQVTLELANMGPRPIILRPGMAISQMVFIALDAPAERPYGSDGLHSKYQLQTGATPSAYAG